MTEQASRDLAPANVTLIRQLYEAFVRGDIDAILGTLSPDVEWGEPPNPFNPAAGVRYGHKGFLEWARIGRETEKILTLEPRKFLSDRDTVAVFGFTRCLAKPTNKIYETDFVHLFTMKEGKIARFQEFFDTYIAGEAFRPD